MMVGIIFVGFFSCLIVIGEFKFLYEQLIMFFDVSYCNSCEENIVFCCDFIELYVKLQGQLFYFLELCFFEGGIYGGSEVLKK